MGGRTIGDLLVSADEVNGSRILVPSLRRWNGTEFVLVPESEWTGKLFAMHNSDTQVLAPCGAVDQKGVVRTMYDSEQFLEVAVHASLLQRPFEACGSPATVMVKTRSSHSWTAELKDFALGGLGGPALPQCVISGPATLCAGGTADLCGPEGPGISYLWSNGATTRCITITGAGTFSLTISAGDCPPTTCTKTVTQSDIPTCDITGASSICAGQTAQLCGPEGQGLTYEWSTGQTSRCITIETAGTYSLTVRGGSCGPATCSKTVTAGSQAVCAISGPETICSGQPVELCGPEGSDLSYQWSTGATSRCITVTSGGTYTLTVSGGSCGPSSCSKTLTQATAPTCAIDGPDRLCPGSSIQLCGPEGAGLTYSWSTGDATRCISVTAGGTYTLTVTAPGCGPSTCSKTIIESLEPNCAVSGPTTICPGQSAELCGPEGSGLTYSWSTGATTRCITIDAGGTYTLTVSGGKCGTATCSKTVTESAGPVCSISGPSTLCPGQTAELCGPDGAGFTYTWSTGATTRCITVDAPGEFTLTVSTPGCGNSTCSKTLLSTPEQVCSISGPTTICPGQSAELCGPEGTGLTYTWSTGATTRCITIDAGGTYTLTVSGGGCAPATCSKTVTEASAPVCSITGPGTLCTGQTAELCGPDGAGFTYSWSTGATTRCITIDAAGDYTLTVSTPGCGSSTCTKSVGVGVETVCSISGPGTLCAGQTAELCGPEGTGLTYTWSTGATTRCITIETGGTFTLTVTGGGCGPTTCSKTVTQAAGPTCAIDGPDRLCPGTSIQLCGPDGSNFTYVWSTGATTRCIDVDAAGTYTLTVTADGCGTSTCSKTVTESLQPSCTVSGPSTICPGQSAELCGPEGSGLTYTWSTGATTRCITVDAAGTYTLTVSGGKCGTATCSKTVEQSAGPVCSIAGPNILCAGQTAELCGPDAAGVTYAWSTGATTRCITISTPGDYTLTVSTPGCGNSVCSKTVKAGTETVCSITGPTTLCTGQTVDLCGPDGTGLTYSWSTGATTRCITVGAGGTYTLTVTSVGGCGPSTCSQTVTETSAPVCSISGPVTVCTGQTVELCGPTGIGISYTWSTGATTRCVTVPAGTYTLTVSSPGCGSSTCSQTVVATSTPTCFISGPNTICAGSSTEICGPDGAGLTYMWSTGETTRCILVHRQQTYSLTVSGGPCGTETCSKQLFASSPPTCSIDGPGSLCAGQTGVLCGPEAFQGTMMSYQWSTGETTRCITIPGPGTYTLTTSTPDCGSATCSKTVVQGDVIACAISGPDDLDPNGTGELCGPEGVGLTYQWSTGATSRCITVTQPGDYTLTVTSANCSETAVSTCTKTVRDRPTSSCRCSFFYPDNSNLPRSAQAFHNEDLLAAAFPGRDGCPLAETKLRLWYNDATAFGLGIRQVVVYTSPTDSTVTNYPVSAPSATPTCVTHPEYGAVDQSGNQSGNDTAVDGGRPIWPVVYITDITFNKDSRVGDWQQGSTSGIPATSVCGVWTTGVRRVFLFNNTVNVTMDPSPAPPNGWNLGSGSDAPPAGFGAYPDKGYGAEVTWDLNSLGFLPGHRYRLYSMIHSGDQAQADGGNAGQACTRVVVMQNGTFTFAWDEPTIIAGGVDLNSGQDVHVGEEDRFASSKTELASIPTRFELYQNAPNPFTVGSKTAIRYSLPERSQVRVAVYSIAGQRVAILEDGTFEPGNRVVEWSGADGTGRALPPGMYVCRLEASAVLTGRFAQVRKMVMIK